MHGREVRYIVEEAAQKDVVGEGVYWSVFFFFFFTLSVNPNPKRGGGFENREKKRDSRQRGGNSRGDDKKDLTGNKDSQILDMLGLNGDLSHGKPHSEEQTTPSHASCHLPRFIFSISDCQGQMLIHMKGEAMGGQTNMH